MVHSLLCNLIIYFEKWDLFIGGVIRYQRHRYQPMKRRIKFKYYGFTHSIYHGTQSCELDYFV